MGACVHTHMCVSCVCVCVCVCFRLSSAVAEHRRSVRPSRRTQGSRNPLRALAARDDVREDFNEPQDNGATVERNRSESLDTDAFLSIQTFDRFYAYYLCML